MKIYEIKLKPKSFFISQMQGDMLFGCLCWQLNNIGQNLDNLLKDYDANPFMVVSSAVYFEEGHYIIPKPLCPDIMLTGQTLPPEKKKEFKKKNFLCLYDNEIIDINEDSFEQKFGIKADDSSKLQFSATQEHNSINRLTNTTGTGEFAPFYTKTFIYRDDGELIVFIALDEEKLSKEILLKAFENLGKTGFGKKASGGYGHFEVLSIGESPLWKHDFSTYHWLYALAPFVPSAEEQENANAAYFRPITKYGKHGDVKASSEKPFKKPVIMADTGSIISLKKPFNIERPFIGSAVKGTSYIDPRTVVQGYALCLPCKLFPSVSKEETK